MGIRKNGKHFLLFNLRKLIRPYIRQ